MAGWRDRMAGWQTGKGKCLSVGPSYFGILISALFRPIIIRGVTKQSNEVTSNE